MSKGKKGRKHGRNKRKPAKMRYTAEKRHFRNKIKKLKKQVKNHPTDLVASMRLAILLNISKSPTMKMVNV